MTSLLVIFFFFLYKIKRKREPGIVLLLHLWSSSLCLGDEGLEGSPCTQHVHSKHWVTAWLRLTRGFTRKTSLRDGRGQLGGRGGISCTYSLWVLPNGPMARCPTLALEGWILEVLWQKTWKWSMGPKYFTASAGLECWTSCIALGLF